MFADAVVTLFENVIYPADFCCKRACGAGANLLKNLTGLDVYEDLCSYYVPGAEDLAVCAALADRFPEPDARLIRKTAAAMAASGVQVAPYEDSREVFSFLQALDVPRGLIVDGPAHTQGLIAEHLQLDRIFPHCVYTEHFSGETPWMEALYYMSLLLDRPLSRTVLICADMEHAHMAAEPVMRVYYVHRPGAVDLPYDPGLEASGIIPVTHLYNLPEFLGLVSLSTDAKPRNEAC